MKLAQLIETLSKELELTQSPIPSTKGAYSLQFDEEITAYLYEYNIGPDNPHDRGIAIWTILTPCQEKGAAALYQAALLGNLFGVATHEAIIGLSPDGKSLTLCREIEYDCDYTDFQDILEEFLNTVEIWRQTASTYQQKVA